MNKVCLGCGVSLQETSKEQLGYTKNLSSNLCERCFRIKHYGEYQTVLKENGEFIELLKKINQTKELVLLVVDLFFFQESFQVFKDTLTDTPIILVLTKRDLLPRSLYEEKILNYMERYGISFIDKIIIDYKNYHMDELMELIRNNKRGENVYVVGYTNAGKSTMINQMIRNYSDLNQEITTSMLPSTTLNLIKVPLNEELTIVDTPGLLEEGSLFHYVDSKMLKQILPKKTVRPMTYQVKTPCSFIVNGLFGIEILETTNLTFFLSNQLKIERVYHVLKKEDEMEELELFVKNHQDIVISGLGFIKISKSCHLKVHTLKGVKVYIRDSLI